MIETYALTKEGSEFPIEMGSLGEMVIAWSKLKYSTNPIEEYGIHKIKIETVKILTRNDIDKVLNKIYEEDDNL